MKIFLFIIVLVSNVLFANDLQVESAIYDKVFTALTGKNNIRVYIHTKNSALHKYAGKLQLVQKCKDADIILLSTLKNLPVDCKGKILFGTRYKQLQNTQVIGAFFWQKGRPNILFYQYRLDQYHIQLDKSFQKYIEK